jgi:hypothetical protein
MNELRSKPPDRRRLMIAAGVGGITLVAFGLRLARTGTVIGEHEAAPAGLAPDATLTVLAFIGALFGRDLSAQDIDDLSERLGYRLSADAAFTHECAVLVQYLESLAREQGAATFISCSDMQKEAIVQQVSRISSKSLGARLLSRVSMTARDYYRMRQSTVWQLSWLYRQSGAAWRARGYRRWPGIPGDWREILVPGSPYP